MLRIKLVKSLIGQVPNNVKQVKALGLGKVGSEIRQNDTPVIRGMIHRCKHLLEVTEEEGTVPKRVPARIEAIQRRKAAAGTEVSAPAPKAKAKATAEAAKPAEEKPKRTTKKKTEADN